MKKLVNLLLFFLSFNVASGQFQWAWMGGDQSINAGGTYGAMNAAGPTYTPGSRAGAVTWKDRNNRIWIFGGSGRGESGIGLLNDLWRFDPATNQWAWMGGPKTPNGRGDYGEQGVSSPGNQPGARQNSIAWTDHEGNFWLFGGLGYGTQNEVGLLNDLWKYSPNSREWTFVNGSNRINQQGRYDNSGRGRNNNDDDDDDEDNGDGDLFPGSRYMSTGWADATGNLWLFGGRGYSSEREVTDLNDMWKYSPSSGEWSWMKGEKEENADAHYGDKGSFKEKNTPDGRWGSTGWKDKQGNFWLFGGTNRSRLHNDLWKFNPVSNEWAWINGSREFNRPPEFDEKGVPDANGNPGSRTLSAGWSDNEGNFWLFGGEGYSQAILGVNALNSLWRYTVASDQWTFATGTIAPHGNADYGSKGTPATGNTPGGTVNATYWRDDEGLLWMFGGESSTGYLNQLWKFVKGCGANLSGTITPASSTICKGNVQILTATGGTSYEWRRNGVTITGQSGPTIKVNEPGTYSVIINNNGCTASASNTAEVILVTAPVGNITPASTAVCEGTSQVLVANGGTSYEWSRNGVIIPGQTSAKLTVTDAGTYSVLIKNGACSGPASNTATVTKVAKPTGSITPASASICEGASQVLTASGGSAYQWFLDGETMEGRTAATITATSPGTYSVIIKNDGCSAEATNTAVISLETLPGSRYADVFVLPNTSAQLTARPIGTSYSWTPESGLSNPASAITSVNTATEQEYLVKITNEGGCVITDTVLVKIITESRVAVPNAFTPNGNNVNDKLRPLGNLASLDYFRVYNRWGNLVFQTNKLGEGWDGTFRGVAQPSDSYMWLLSGKAADGEPVKLTGKTLLIR